MHYAELAQARAELTGPGGAFEIEEIEILGQRLRNYKNAPQSVREFWLSTAAFADRPYLVYGDETLTYAQTHAKADAVAAWLLANGVKPGDRVAVALRNFPEWMVIYWACVSVGVAVVGMSAWWTQMLFCAGVVMVVTMNLSWVGILIVNSLLIVPAAGARNVARNARQYVFYAVGIALFSGVSGLLLSYYANTATGATIVLVAMACYVVTLGLKAARNRA